MLPFRQLVSTVSLAFVVLQTHQYLHGTGQALARPVGANAIDDAFNLLSTQPRADVPDSDSSNEATVNPEAVLKALQALANGIQSQSDGESRQPVMVISHGEGGPIKPDATPSTGKQDQQPTKNKSDPGKPKSSDAAKAAMKALQHPRTRFCAQAANTNSTIDSISQTLVKKERKRLAAIRRQRAAKPSSQNNATDARTLTDAKLLAEQTKTVSVVWHVIHSGTAGNVTDAMIAAQIETLNEDYRPYGFAFDLNATDRVDNARWFNNISPDTALQTQMMSALRQGDAAVLNLYSVDFQNGLLGYAAFPWDVEDNLVNDGVVFQYSTVPGGSETGYNLGKTATHEVGHWLGLYHVFQGGCNSPGDYVDDTPPQSVATSGCPTGQDSCSGGGVDSIHNYMDYSSDACYTGFTDGQAVRMAALTAQYRSL
ncbi:related to metalloprotease [Sporisorium reilianum SRZ2]|uniref:Related to metalloprotease n=1 Tax=Sporisorium reilianum (strain SRZ2) TaxID=999809 RepID=E6ZKG1_SPORE|nr:related to metalloprotease [Sporisorium reilianum SRZ2]